MRLSPRVSLEVALEYRGTLKNLRVYPRETGLYTGTF